MPHNPRGPPAPQPGMKTPRPPGSYTCTLTSPRHLRSFTDLQLSARILAKLPMIVVTRWPAVRNRSQRSPGLRFATPVCRVCCFTEGGLYGFRHINRSALCHCRRTVFVLLEEQARLDCANTGHSGLMWDSGDFCRELGDRSIHLLDVLIA